VTAHCRSNPETSESVPQFAELEDTRKESKELREAHASVREENKGYSSVRRKGHVPLNHQNEEILVPKIPLGEDRKSDTQNQDDSVMSTR